MTGSASRWCPFPSLRSVALRLCILASCLSTILSWPSQNVAAQPDDAGRAAGQDSTSTFEPPRVFPGEYVVSMRQTANLRAFGGDDLSKPLGTLAPPAGAGILREDLGGGAYLVTPPVAAMHAGAMTAAVRRSVPFTYVDTFCRNLLASGRVSACSPNYELRALEVVKSDPLEQIQWGLSSDRGVAAARAWEISTGSPGVVATVIDTGVDATHPDLVANLWSNPGEIANNGIDDDGNGFIDDVHGINAISSAPAGASPHDDNGHGTHVAGTIGAVGENGIGVAGVVPHARIMALKFLDGSGSGGLSDAVRAIEYMVMMKTRYGVPIVVANNSWGGGDFSGPLYEAFGRARDAGIIMVGAAGNESNDNEVLPLYPASFDLDNVVSVAAIDRQGNLADFSNYGFSSVDIAAPGVDILSTVPGGGYAFLSGTSMATPHVTGALLLLAGAEPSLSMGELLDRLYGAGRDGQSLRDAASGEPLVRTQRFVDVGRMVHQEVTPLPPTSELPALCGYDLQVENVRDSRGVDTAADSQEIVNQTDEGEFTRIALPFAFPFFRGTSSTAYLSPNGVLYFDSPPRSLDYTPGNVAPRNAIAALHTDLVPRKAKHGVRVFTSPEKVTVAWVAEYFGIQDGGDIKVRLTLYPSGRIVASVAFSKDDPTLELQRTLFGDPFSSPQQAPGAVIGATGGSSRYASVVDLLAAQRQLSPDGLIPLLMHVTMIPNCFPYVEEPQPVAPVVESITVKRTSARARSSRTTPIDVFLRGKGTGTIKLRAKIDGWSCSGSKEVLLDDGAGNVRTLVPAQASSVTIATGDVSETLKLSRASLRRISQRSARQACVALFAGM